MCYLINKGGFGVFPNEPVQPGRKNPKQMFPLRNVLHDGIGNKYYFDEGWNLVAVAEKPKSLESHEAESKWRWILENPTLAFEKFKDSWSMIERALARILFEKISRVPATHSWCPPIRKSSNQAKSRRAA